MSSNLLRLALPMIVGQLAFASMGFIDTLLLGQLGVETLAAGALGAMVFQFFHIVGIGVLVATANLIAFEYGKDSQEGIQTALLSGVISVLLLTFAFALVVVNASPILLMFGQDAQLIPITTLYLDIIVWGLLPAFSYILLRSLALGLGDSSAVLPVSVIAAAANYPISYALMTGLWGLPEMGVQGVALGTVIVASFMAVAMGLLIYRKDKFKVHQFWRNWQYFRFSNLVETYRLGVQIAIAHAMEIGMFSAAALIIGTMGVQSLAAHQIVLQCVTMSFMFPLGLSQAVSVKVGKHFGAGNAVATKHVIELGMLIATCTALIAGLIFWLLPEVLVDLFIDDGISQAELDALVQTATVLLLVGAMFQLVDGWQVVLMGVLRGFKLATSPTVVATLSYWGLGFPAAYLLGDVYGPAGVWSGMGIGLAASAILLLALTFRTYNRAF